MPNSENQAVEPDNASVLRSNLERVFNERDAALRAHAVAELFTDMR